MRSGSFKSVVDLFEARVAVQPDAPAIAANDQCLSYVDLNMASNSLARRLRAFGVRPEVRVGICAARTSVWPIAILAVLKAGGTYVPLDRRYPDAHLRQIVAETSPIALISDGSAPGQIVSMIEHVFHPLPHRGDQIAADAVDLHVEIPAAALAYIIYTSGSAGRPNGVMVSHQAVRTYVRALSRELQLQSGTSYLHTASFAFSSSVRQLLVPLSQGLQVILAATPPDSLDTLRATSRNQQRLTIDLTPSLYRQLIADQSSAQQIPGLFRILSASESLPSDVATQLALLPSDGGDLFNMYGQTETTGIVALSKISAGTGGKPPPIGRPIANVRVYVLDRHLSPVAIGLPGEIYIGGSGLARGYLGRPDRTAERFVPSPYTSGERLYRTGDLGRWCPDGNLEFLGRGDQQIKLRGFRVELGEVESSLRAHPEVRDAVVMLREDTPGDARLVSYLIPTRSVPPVRRLRAFLRQRLPDYMVPSAFVTLTAFPLTPNGKLDRGALPRPETTHELEMRFVAPRTPTEEALATIWSDVLKVEQIGIHDNFFELGGHSLLATALVARATKRFGVRVSLLGLMSTPSVAAMAAQIDSERHTA
jgi:amino acid adenylation domain-containing protein